MDKDTSAENKDVRTGERRAVLISSPHAGNAIHAERLAAWLGRVGIAVTESLLISDLDHTQPQGMRWRARGDDLAIVAGGDGAIGSVATQLAGSGLPLAILPMGTANDVARSLLLPMDVEEACTAVAGAVPMEIDVGQVLPGLTEPGAYAVRHEASAHEAAQLADEPSPVAGVYFVHASTLGLNVEFARLATDIGRRRRLGRLNYAASAIEAMTHFHPIDVRLRLFGMEGVDDETVIESHAMQVSIVNTSVFGGRMGVRLPDVRLHDRQLDFMLVEAADARRLRQTIQRLLASPNAAEERPEEPDQPGHQGEPAHLPGVRRFRARAAIIETPEPVDVTLDGEIRTHTPVLVRVAPQSLRVLVTPQAKHLLARDRLTDDVNDIEDVDAAPRGQ